MIAEALMAGLYFGLIGPTEIVIILVIALLVFGPDKLPEIGKQIGSIYRELNRMRGDMQRALDLDEYSRYDAPSYGPPQGTTYASTETHAIESYHEYATNDLPSEGTTESEAHPVIEASGESGEGHGVVTAVAHASDIAAAETIAAETAPEASSAAHSAQEAKEH
jgi:sec-independent protein translocase protein TatA